MAAKKPDSNPQEPPKSSAGDGAGKNPPKKQNPAVSGAGVPKPPPKQPERSEPRQPHNPQEHSRWKNPNRRRGQPKPSQKREAPEQTHSPGRSPAGGGQQAAATPIASPQPASDLKNREAAAASDKKPGDSKDGTDLDEQEEKAGKENLFDKDELDQYNLGRFKNFMSSKKALWGMGISLGAGSALGLLLFLAPVFIFFNIIGTLTNFELGSNESFRITRAAKISSAIKKGGVDAYKAGKRSGDFDTFFSRRINDGLYDKSIDRIRANDDTPRFKDSPNADGRKYLAGVETADGRYIDFDSTKPGAIRQRIKYNKVLYPGIKGIIARNTFATPFLTRTGGTWDRWFKAVAVEGGRKVRSVFPERTAKDTDGKCNSSCDDFKEAKNNGATDAQAKDYAATKKAGRIIGRAGITYIAVVVGCTINDIASNDYKAKAEAYGKNIRNGLQKMQMAAEIGQGLRDPRFADIDLELVGTAANDIYNRKVQTLQDTPKEDGTGNSGEQRVVETVDTFADSQEFRRANGDPTGGIPLDPALLITGDHTGLALDALSWAKANIDGLASWVGEALNSSCDYATGFFGRVVGYALDAITCTATLGACLAAGEALSIALSEVLGLLIDTFLRADLGNVPETAVQTTENDAQSLNSYGGLMSRTGEPVADTVYNQQVYEYIAQYNQEKVEEASVWDRYFAIDVPGSIGRNLAIWKVNSLNGGVAKFIASIGRVPQNILASFSKMISGQQAVHAATIEKNNFGEQAYSLAHIAEKDFDTPQGYIDDIYENEYLVNSYFYGSNTVGTINNTSNTGASTSVTRSELARAFAKDCMGFNPGEAIDEQRDDTENMLLLYNGAPVIDERFQDICISEASRNLALYKKVGEFVENFRIFNAIEVSNDYTERTFQAL